MLKEKKKTFDSE